MLSTDFLIAGRNLLRHTRRSLFLGGALAAVTCLIVLVSSLTNGIEAAMMESATTLMTGHVNVGGFFKITSGSAAPLVSDYPRVLEKVRPLVPGLDHVAARGRGFAKVVSEASSMDIVLSGVEIADEPGFAQLIRPLDGKVADLAQPGTMLLFQGQADRLKVKAGDMVTLSAPTSRGVNNTADVRVAVVAHNVGILSAFTAFIEQRTLWQLYGLNPSATGALQLYLRDPSQANAVAARMREALARDGYRVMDPDAQPYWMKLMQKVPSEDWTGQKLDVSTWHDEMGQFEQFINGVRWVAWLVVVVLLVVVIIGLLNMLAIAVRERTREIGALRAIGMQRTKVLWLFVLETALLGLAGAGAGALMGTGIALVVNAVGKGIPESMQFFLMQERWHFLLQPGWIFFYVLLFTAVTVVAALYPAFRAARLRPVTAMHHVG
jgi:ABC-type lipoprotein release transport system permease subunit